MKKLICLMLVMCVVVLSGCGAFGSKINTHWLENVKIYQVISLENKTSTDDYLFECGEYEFYTNTYRYLGHFTIVARQVSYNPYPDIDNAKTRYIIKVDKDTYEKYKDLETTIRLRVVI